MKNSKSRVFFSLTKQWIQHRFRKHVFVERRHVVQNEFFMSNIISFVFFRFDFCSCFQLISQSIVLIQNFAINVSIEFQINECVRILCFAISRNDKTSIFANQWKIYNFVRDDQKNKNVIQILFLYSKFVKNSLIDCSTNVFIYVLS